MFHARKWFTGFIIIQLKEGFINTEEGDDGHKCSAYQDILYYDCSYREFTSFPPASQLNPKMQILNISENTISTLGKDDLKPYTELRELSMFNLGHLKFFSVDFFTPLQKLKILNMNNSKLTNPIRLPISIRILYAAEISSDYAKAIDLDLSELINLRNLSFAHNGIQGFPILNQKAPLLDINLRGNPITNIEYTNLAPYCKLERFELEKYTSGKQFAEKCCGVLLWLERFQIQNYLSCERIDGIKCESTTIAFSETATELRNECLGISTYLFFLISNIVIGVALIVAFVYMTIRYYGFTAVKAHRKKDKKVSEESSLEEENATD